VLWDFLAFAAYEPGAASAKAVPIVAESPRRMAAGGGFRVYRRARGRCDRLPGRGNSHLRSSQRSISTNEPLRYRLRSKRKRAAEASVRNCCKPCFPRQRGAGFAYVSMSGTITRLYAFTNAWDFGFCRIASFRTGSEDGLSEWCPDDPDHPDQFVRAAGPRRRRR
jgi:hypothetical protein